MKTSTKDCTLGKLCQNPSCLKHFPRLATTTTSRRSRNRTAQRPWEGDGRTLTTWQEPGEIFDVDDEIELIVVECRPTGTHPRVLQAIKVPARAPLSEVRRRLQASVHFLRHGQFSFLRLVDGGRAVRITDTQEQESTTQSSSSLGSSSTSRQSGTYRARDFHPPFAPSPRLYLTVESGDKNTNNSDNNNFHKTPSSRSMTTSQRRPRRFVRPRSSVRDHGDNGNHFYYTAGQHLPDETKTREFKSLALALQHGTASVPRDVVKSKAAIYINAFLNASDNVATLYLGVSDDGRVERVPIFGNDRNCTQSPTSLLLLQEQVDRARAVKDDLRKLVDAMCVQMDPTVDADLVTTRFVPVRRADHKGNSIENDDGEQARAILRMEDEIYVVMEISVRPGRWSLYFIDAHSNIAYIRREGSTQKLEPVDIRRALATRRPGVTTWDGGWRRLQSPFDFDSLMRRLSDPWAGREWLFAAVRQALWDPHTASLYFSAPQQHMPCYGVALIGARGMGKSSFLSELILRPPNVTRLQVIAHHLCRTDHTETLNPATFVLSLAAQLAQQCKVYRDMLIDQGSFSTGQAMLQALSRDFVETNPDEALAQGILRPLQDWYSSRSKNTATYPESQHKAPLVIVLDGLDEALLVNLESASTRRGSSTIVHLLERGLTSIGLPPWIKLVVSFRKEVFGISSGPLQRLSERLHLISMDIPDDDNELAKFLRRQSEEDIHLYAQAFLEKSKMASPLGCSVGKGKWDFTLAAQATARLRMNEDRSPPMWEYESRPGGHWSQFDEFSQVDIQYCRDSGRHVCYLAIGKQAYRVDFASSSMHSLKSAKIQNVRQLVPIDTSSIPNLPEKSTRYVDESIVCDRCKARGHIGKFCPTLRKLAEARMARLRQENEILNAFARNARGNYLYARTVMEDIRVGALQWNEVPSLPSGLDHLYNRFFLKHLGPERGGHDSDNEQGNRPHVSIRAVKPVLEILLAASKRGISEADISHACVAGGACDPVGVNYCLRDIQWALDIDTVGGYKRFSLRHESIRSWLNDESNTKALGLEQEKGHACLAASLLQRCWPQQMLLSNWLRGTAGPCSVSENIDSSWYARSSWIPNKDDIDVYHLARHLAHSKLGNEDERVNLLKTIGSTLLNSSAMGRFTAVHSASLYGDTAALKLLLAAGASADLSIRGRRPIHSAASKGFSQTVQMLLEAGADPTSVSTSGRTPLLNAVGRGSVNTVKVLLRAIAEMEREPNYLLDLSEAAFVDACQSDTGRTPLSLACEYGYNDVIDLLLAAGASTDVADRWGRTPLYYGKNVGRKMWSMPLYCSLTIFWFQLLAMVVWITRDWKH